MDKRSFNFVFAPIKLFLRLLFGALLYTFFLGKKIIFIDNNAAFIYDDLIMTDTMELLQKNGFFKAVIRAGQKAANTRTGLCYFPYGPKHILLVTRPEHIRAILGYGSEAATRNEPFKAFGQLLGNKNQFLLREPEAGENRRFLTKCLYDIDRTNTILERIPEEIHQLIYREHLHKLDQHGVIDLGVFLTTFTMDALSRTVLGLGKIDQATAIEMSDMILNVFKSAVDPKTLITMLLLPKRFYAGGKCDMIHLHEELKQLFMKSFNFSRELTHLAREIGTIRGIDWNNPTEAHKEIICSDICTFLIAGHETTALTFLFSLKLLAMHTDKLQRLRTELQKVDHNDFKKIMNVGYLKKVIKETLRLYPPAALFPRGVEKDILISSGVTIKKGELIVLAPFITQRLAEFWQNPQEFEPERFDDNDVKNIMQGDGKYFPFGYGSRKCLGWIFAECELQLLLAAIVLNFDFHIENNSFEIELTGTLKPQHKAMTTFTRRTLPFFPPASLDDDSLPTKSAPRFCRK